MGFECFFVNRGFIETLIQLFVLVACSSKLWKLPALGNCAPYCSAAHPWGIADNALRL